jgi:hypothetical protein
MILVLSINYIFSQIKNISTLLNSNFYDKLKKMMNVSELKLSLIYKAKRDGFKKNEFHSRCDGKAPTISVIKSEHGKTFGGYKNLS